MSRGQGQRQSSGMFWGGHRLVLALVLGAGLGWILVQEREGMMPPCAVYQATGLLCPGCGAMRAIHDVMHGAPLSALRNNALVVIGGPLLLLGGLLPARARQASANGADGGRGWRALLWLLGLIAAFTLLRNLDFAWFLQPT